MDFLVDLFLPHHSNNHRPNILHHKSLLVLVGFLCSLQLFLFAIKSTQPTILGLATDITVENLLEETNLERGKNGLSKLTLNQELTLAASQKAQDMFSRNYWAHNGPDGTTPWVFIKGAGYDYSFAGENLARDFLQSKDVVKAWMASPKHRDNILSNNFEDIGLAVMDGKLNGKDTTLVVQVFGKKSKMALVEKQPAPFNVRGAVANQGSLVYGARFEPLFDINQMSRNFSILILSILITVLLIDIILVKKKRVVRLVGHNFDHILFLTGPLLLSIFHTRGSIL